MIYGQRMIYFSDDQEIFPIAYKLKMLIRRAVDTTLSFEGFENDCEVSITLTDNQKIHALNLQYREVDRPTDVLSFPLTDYEGNTDEPEADEPCISLGDIVISLEKAAEQAETYGHSFDREVAFLTVHSMLHLLGYDHELGEAEDIDMRARQSAIMTLMGLDVTEA